MRASIRLITLFATAALTACLGGPQVGDGDDGGGDPTPTGTFVPLAPNDGRDGIRLINPDTPGSAVVAEADSVEPIFIAAERTLAADGAFSNARSDFVVYENAGTIFKIDLAAGASTNDATPISSEPAACGNAALYNNDPDSSQAIYVYTASGDDDACNTNDDERRAVRIGMSETDTPLTLPQDESIISVLQSANGAIAGWLMFDGDTLTRYDASFTSRRSVENGAAIATPEAPKTRDATGVLFVDGNDVRYYNRDTNTLSDPPIYSKAANAQFGVFKHDATHTYFSEADPATNQTNIRRVQTNGGAAVQLLGTESGNVANVLELTENRVIYRAANGAVRSLPKDGSSAAITLREPSAGTTLSMQVMNERVLITESDPQPTLFIYAEDSNTPIGSQRENTVVAGFTRRVSGNLYGNDLSQIIAVRRLGESTNDASGAVIKLDPGSAVEVVLGTLSTDDAQFKTQASQVGDFGVGYSLNAGSGLARLFSFDAGQASSLTVAQ